MQNRTLSPCACTIWFTGLSGAGRAMILDELAPQLKTRGGKIAVVDDEVVRADLNPEFVPFHRDDERSPLRRVVTCRQLNAGGAFTIAAESADEGEIVCDAAHEAPGECAQKIMRKLEQLGYLSPFANMHEDGHHVYSGEEEALVTKRLEELGYA
jgi:adenylylsulfate kinase-like enzyme